MIHNHLLSLQSWQPVEEQSSCRPCYIEHVAEEDGCGGLHGSAHGLSFREWRMKRNIEASSTSLEQYTPERQMHLKYHEWQQTQPYCEW